MTSSDQPRSVLCLGLGDTDRSRVSEEAHRFGWLIRFAGNATEARATGNGKRPDLILFDVNAADDAASELVRQCTAHPLHAVSPAPQTQSPQSTPEAQAPAGTPKPEMPDGTVLLEPGSIHRFEDYEQQILRHALQTTGWNVKRAAQLLGIGRATLYRKIDRYKLREYQPERNAG
ncbi:MAG: helix-turn-helix domain-containing protein [Planctomycetota bacterium]